MDTQLPDVAAGKRFYGEIFGREFEGTLFGPWQAGEHPGFGRAAVGEVFEAPYGTVAVVTGE